MFNAPIKISWDGKEYSTNIDMRLITAIDAEIDLVAFIDKRIRGAAQITKVATIIAIILDRAGVEIKVEGKREKRPIMVDDVYSAIYVDDEMSAKEANEFIRVLLPLMMPQPKKKAASESKKKPVKVKKKK